MMQKPLRHARLPRRAALTLCAALGTAASTPPATAKPTFTIFDPPGSANTMPTSISADGTITGVYSNGTAEVGFVRAPDGTFATFDPDGAVTNGGVAINAADAVVGMYTDSNSIYHGFLRAADGTIQPIDDPDAGTDVYEGTGTAAINSKGAITGGYINGTGNPNGDRATHGYVRDPAGNFSEFDPPGSCTPPRPRASTPRVSSPASTPTALAWDTAS